MVYLELKIFRLTYIVEMLLLRVGFSSITIIKFVWMVSYLLHESLFLVLHFFTNSAYFLHSLYKGTIIQNPIFSSKIKRSTHDFQELLWIACYLQITGLILLWALYSINSKLLSASCIIRKKKKTCYAYFFSLFVFVLILSFIQGIFSLFRAITSERSRVAKSSFNHLPYVIPCPPFLSNCSSSTYNT